MPNYWGNKFSHTGDSPKWVKSKRRREKERKKEKRGLNDIDNNGQATYGTRKPPGPKSTAQLIKSLSINP